MHLYFHMLIIHCVYLCFFPFFSLSRQVWFECHSSVSLCLWCIFFYHSVRREDLLGSAEKENASFLFFFFFCYLALMGSEINVAFFWTNTRMRSSLSGDLALFTIFLGQSVILKHRLYKFLIWQRKTIKCSSYLRGIIFAVLQLKPDWMYKHGIFNPVSTVMPSCSLL